MRLFGFYVLLSCMLLGLWIFACSHTRRFDITDDRAIRAIVGEYSKNDELGMRMFAHAIRNRGTLKGVNGLRAYHVRREPGYIWKLASLAWFESKTEADLTDGADSWYSTSDYQKQGMPKGKTLLFRYKDTMFFISTKHTRR